MGTLQLTGLTKRFDGVVALDDISLQLTPGRITALIGPNGAGKSTLFNVVTGFLRPDAGTVCFDGQAITGWDPASIARLGIARTFQQLRLFNHMSVLENLMVAHRYARGETIWAALGQTRAWYREETDSRDAALRLLHLVGLRVKQNNLAGSLSHGQRRLLELAKALALDPQLLLLDEPTAGVFPGMAREITGLIRGLREDGRTIFFIEHNMRVVMDMADTIVVISYGKKLAEGPPAEVKENEAVIAAYSGRHLGRSPQPDTSIPPRKCSGD